MSKSDAIKLTDSSQLWEKANAFADHVLSRLHAIAGEGADVMHIGATSVRGVLTKGDVDVVIRSDAEAFPTLRNKLDAHFKKNTGSERSDQFASYIDNTGEFPLGIQLVVKNSPNDFFHTFKERLASCSDLRQSYNALKTRFVEDGEERYRAAKAEFIHDALSRGAA